MYTKHAADFVLGDSELKESICDNLKENNLIIIQLLNQETYGNNKKNQMEILQLTTIMFKIELSW